jgi:hypothetical protein
MHADLSFSYLRFAEAASFDKKELRRSCTIPSQTKSYAFLFFKVSLESSFQPTIQLYLLFPTLVQQVEGEKFVFSVRDFFISVADPDSYWSGLRLNLDPNLDLRF